MRACLAASLIGLVALMATGCINDRYVGAIGPTGTYANRGYGIAVALSYAGLNERWTVVDPREPNVAAHGMKPIVRDLPIDLNGDGVIHHDEVTRYIDPTLRLVSKTSTATWIDIQVDILGGKLAKAKLDDLMHHHLKGVTGKSYPLDRWERRRLAPDFDARVGEIQENGVRLAIIDHQPFRSEEGTTRRQLLRILLRAPSLDAGLRADHNLLLRSIALNHESGPLTRQEKF